MELIEKIKKELVQHLELDEQNNITLKHPKIPSFKLMYLQGGKFMMGDKNNEFGDAPKHEAEVSPFFMAEMLLTQEIYEALTEKNPSHFQGVNHPVEQVSWFQAMDFCNLLNKEIGLTSICDGEYNLLDSKGKITTNITEVAGFRLATEAEWEYAARGEELTTYAGSEQVDYVAWYVKNNAYETKPVGLKFPNKFGIYDMSGNLWEWCLDVYDKNYYKKNPSKNRANLKEKSSRRVIRGGSWGNDSDGCRVAYRYHGKPSNNWYGNGFRLVFSLPCSLQPKLQWYKRISNFV